MKISDALQKLGSSDKEFRTVMEEINGDLFLPSYLEGKNLIHTIPYVVLKNVLRDGFLTGNEEHLRRDFKYKAIFHPNMICFSSLPERHLSAMPDLPMIMVSHDCYLKFPFFWLRSKYKVRPVLYKITWWELEKLFPYEWSRLVKKEICEAEYGSDFPSFIYNPMWIVENEWRVKDKDIVLEEPIQVFVANRRQEQELRKITFLKIEIDPLLHHLTRYQNLRYRLTKFFDKVLKEKGFHCKNHLWDSRNGKFTLYDVLPIGMELEDLVKIDYLEARKMEEEWSKEVGQALLQHFSRVRCEFHRDFIVDLLTKRKTSNAPNPYI